MNLLQDYLPAHVLIYCYFSRDWRAKQQSEIVARDEASKARRQETIAKAERSLDDFYEEHSKKKERSIRDNKHVVL